MHAMESNISKLSGESHNKSRFIGISKTLLRLGICLGLLFWIFNSIFSNEARSSLGDSEKLWQGLSWFEQFKLAWTVGPKQLWMTFKLVEFYWFLISLVFMGLTIVLGALRWQKVLMVHGFDLPFGRVFSISLVAQFFNAFLLGSTGGDLLKAYYVARETHHKKAEAVVTVFIDRLIGLFSMLLFACLLFPFNVSFLFSTEPMVLVSIIVLCMAVACGVVIYLAFWGGVSRHWTGARQWLRKMPKGELIERCLDACRMYGKASGFLTEALLISMGLNIACVVQLWTLAFGLDLNVDFSQLAVTVPIVICIAAIPITPSGLGVRENLYVLMLAGSGSKTLATSVLAMSLLAYAGFLIWSIIGGLVYIAMKDVCKLDELETKNNESSKANSEITV